MDWTYFASKWFKVTEFQREASTKPVVVPMSKATTIAVRASAELKLSSRISKTFKRNQPGRIDVCCLMHCNAFPHALLKIARQSRFNPPSGEFLSQFRI